MIKLSKKVVAVIVVSLSFIVSSPVSAVAASLNSSSTTSSDEIVIYINSEQELKEFEQELAKQNALAEQKWQEALERSDTGLNVCEDIRARVFSSVNSRTSTYSSGSKYFFKYYTIDFEFGRKYGNWFGKDRFSGYLTLVGSTYTNSYGTPFFGSINSVTFKSKTTKDDVEDFTYQTVRLDASRTCAVHASCYVLVYRSSSESRRYPVTFYKEFYASQNY